MNALVSYDGADITSSIVKYSRQQQICTGIGNALFTLKINAPITPQTYKEVILYEGDIKKGTYIVAEYTKNVPEGTLTLNCQDYSKRVQDYFIDKTTTVTTPVLARDLIAQFLTEAGVTYSFNTSDPGNYVNNNSVFGLTDALSTITALLQMNGWYMYFDPEKVAQIGRFNYDSDTANMTLTGDEVSNFSSVKKDTMFRNRVVVWGMGNPETQSWVFAEIDQHGRFENEYDQNDVRSVVVANGDIPDNSVAMTIARQAIEEFTKINFEVSITAIGPQNIAIGDQIFLDTEQLQFLGRVTTIGSELSYTGHTTNIVLNQRCPRLFSYFDFGGYVYIGTEDQGVWRKHLKYEHIWTDYSEGLTSSGISDLYVTNGKLACTTYDGKLWQRNVTESGWVQVTMSGMTRFGHPISEAQLDFVGVTINNADSTIYSIANLKGAVLGGENCYFLSKSGSGGTLENVNYLEDFIITGIDIDTDNTNPVLTVLVGGKIYVDHNIVRNTSRDFERFEDNRLSDLKNGISRSRRNYQRSHPGWDDGQMQGTVTTFWGDYAYQFIRTYIGSPLFDHIFTGIQRQNIRLSYPDNINDPNYKFLNYYGTGVNLGKDADSLALIDFDKVVAAGANGRGIDIFDYWPTVMSLSNFSTGSIQVFPPTLNFQVDLVGGGFYATPNAFVVGVARRSTCVLTGLIYNGRTDKTLSDETNGDVIVNPFIWSAPHVNGGMIACAMNVNGVTYGVYVSSEVKNTTGSPQGYSYRTFGFRYGVDLRTGDIVNKNFEKLLYNTQVIPSPLSVSGGWYLSRPGAIGVDYVERAFYFSAVFLDWRDGELGRRLYKLNFDGLDISEVELFSPDGCIGNDKRFYFYTGSKIYRPTDLDHEICTLPAGAVISSNLDNYTNMGVFSLWVPLPNPDNVAHYEAYEFDPEFGTYSLLDKLNTNGYIDFDSIEAGLGGYDFRGDKLIIGGDSQWVLFPEFPEDFQLTANIPMTLIARSGIINSGLWNTRTFDYSTAMSVPAKIEISNYSPYAVYGKPPVTYINSMNFSISGYVENPSGILYMSDTAGVGTWDYNPPLPSSGNVIDVRSYQHMVNASGIELVTIFTQETMPSSGVVASGLHSVYTLTKNVSDVYERGILETFSGIPTFIETGNYGDQPYIFVAVSGVTLSGNSSFYQRDRQDGTTASGVFNLYNDHLPNSRITVIRVDNRI